jgi:hypothetical protein
MSTPCTRNTFPHATPIEKRRAFGMDRGLLCLPRGQWSPCRLFVLASARAGPVATRRKLPDSAGGRSGPRTSGLRRPVGGRGRCQREISLLETKPLPCEFRAQAERWNGVAESRPKVRPFCSVPPPAHAGCVNGVVVRASDLGVGFGPFCFSQARHRFRSPCKVCSALCF